MTTRMMVRVAVHVAGLAGLVLAQPIPIREVRKNNSSGEPLLNGQTVTVTGVVTASTHFGASRGPAFLQDSTGGVALYDSVVKRLRIGDSITVTARVTLYNGLTELQYASLENHGRVEVPAPKRMRLADVSRIDTLAGFLENEGWLVQIDSVRIEHTPGQRFQGNTNYNISDPSGATGQLRIDADAVELIGLPIPDGPITVTAVVGQYKSSSPFFGGYQLMPRLAEDLGFRVTVVSIAEIIADTDSDFVPDRLGDSVVTTGIVTVPSGVFSTSNTDIYIQDATAGVNVFNYGTTTVELGDSVVVAGIVDQYKGKTELSSATITVVAHNRTVPSPKLVPFNYPLTERDEGQLLLLVGDVVQEPVRSGSGSNIVIKNGTPAIAVRVNDPTGIDLSWVTVGRRIRFIGIGGQYDPDEPYNSGYQLMPRFQTDLCDTTAAFEPSEWLRIDTITPNPFAPREGQVLTIQVNSPRSFRLTVELYDLEGRLVKDLMANAPGGYYDLKWDGTDRLGRPLPAGIYLLAIRGATGSGQTKVISKPVALAEDLR